jgi:hypothetical protein
LIEYKKQTVSRTEVSSGLSGLALAELGAQQPSATLQWTPKEVQDIDLNFKEANGTLLDVIAFHDLHGRRHEATLREARSQWKVRIQKHVNVEVT